MAKKKKQTIKNVPIKWFNSMSAKKGFLLFVAVFAIIGGSYMLYGSFAATSESKLYNIDKFNGTNSYCGLVKLIDSESTSKNKSEVIKLSAKNDGCGLFPPNTTPYMIADSSWSSWLPVSMRLCVFVRSSTNLGDNSQFNADANFNTPTGRITLKVEPSVVQGIRDYQKLCSQNKIIPAGVTSHNIYISNADTNRDIYFAWASLEYIPVQ